MAASLGQADAMIAACEERTMLSSSSDTKGRFAAANIETRRLVGVRERLGEPTTSPSQREKARWIAEYRHTRHRWLERFYPV